MARIEVFANVRPSTKPCWSYLENRTNPSSSETTSSSRLLTSVATRYVLASMPRKTFRFIEMKSTRRSRGRTSRWKTKIVDRTVSSIEMTYKPKVLSWVRRGRRRRFDGAAQRGAITSWRGKIGPSTFLGNGNRAGRILGDRPLVASRGPRDETLRASGAPTRGSESRLKIWVGWMGGANT